MGEPEFFNILIQDARLALDYKPVDVYGWLPVDKNTWRSWEMGWALPGPKSMPKMRNMAARLNLDIDEVYRSIAYTAPMMESSWCRVQKYAGLLDEMLWDPEDEERITRLAPWYPARDKSGRFYVYTNVPAIRAPYTTLKMHRLVMNAPEGVLVDHINGNGLDNRKVNLRLANHAQNHWNAGKKNMGRPTHSRFKGVYLHTAKKTGRQRWLAQIRIEGGKRISIGYYDDELDAALAYDEAARKYHGEFAYLNLPNYLGGS
jgi:hypothetical protein